MEKYSINDSIIIFPNPKGWLKIRDILSNIYKISDEELDEFLTHRYTENYGYKDQMWFIMSEFGIIFSQGTDYLKSLNIDFCNDSF